MVFCFFCFVIGGGNVFYVECVHCNLYCVVLCFIVGFLTFFFFLGFDFGSFGFGTLIFYCMILPGCSVLYTQFLW